MTLFQTLLKEQAPTIFKRSEERYFYDHLDVLLEHKSLSYLAKKTDHFGIIRSNLILRAIFAKDTSIFEDNKGNPIDPFDHYGFSLYETKYSTLVVIDRYKDVMAAYDNNTESIYLINEQGRLDNEIALFDKRLKKPNKENIIGRAKAVVDAYFNNDRDGMITALYNEKFISEKLFKSLVEEKR